MHKLAMICTILTLIIIIACGCAMPSSAEGVILTAKVVNSEWVAPDLWRVDCSAEDGNVWSFFADDDWTIGAEVLLTLDAGQVAWAIYNII